VCNVNFQQCISWRSVLLVEETGENHWPVASQWQTLSHNVISSTPRLSRVWTGKVIGTDSTCSYNPTTIRSWWPLFYNTHKCTLKKEFVFHCQMLNYISVCDDVTMTTWWNVNVFISLGDILFHSYLYNTM